MRRPHAWIDAVGRITCAAYRTEDALILTLSRLRCADPCRTGGPVGVGSGDRRGLTQVWGSAREGTREQAAADGRTFCATTGAGSVRHGAFYVKSYKVGGGWLNIDIVGDDV